MADYDPSIIERQLVPLGDPIAGSGLTTIDRRVRYRLDSALYREATTAGDGGGAPDDRSALGAAAQRAAGEE
jgi:hypothetical protein